ncbi:tape measure protein [Pseudoalteromonas sp. MT33b]|uniref:tape measure protein n=1 Tax=Pseudoalteromonas sp. MT33b TaxID=2759705 RepID=UPI002174EF7C|nr:tape measure protein [Pseudoalteromonas sp. MT33b]
MSNNLNLALRLRYDGKAVTAGARQNVNDINRIKEAAKEQSRVAKDESAKQVDSFSKKTSALNRVPIAIHEQIPAYQRVGVSQAAAMKQQSNAVRNYANELNVLPKAIDKQAVANEKSVVSQKTTSAKNNASVRQSVTELNRVPESIQRQVTAQNKAALSYAKTARQQQVLTRKTVTDLNRVPAAIQRQVAANQQLGVSQATVMRQQGAMNRQLGLMNTAYGQLGATLTTLVSIGTATMFVRDTGAAQMLDTRLKGLTSSTREYERVQAYLFETADRLNTGYTTLADSYSKILTLQDAGVVTQEQGIAILEGMANAAAKTGASNVQLGQSLFGMTQGMTAGVLRAEELNQVTEPMPGLLQKLDKAAGKAAGGFRQMVNDGQVTSQMFKNYLIKALEDYAGAAEATEGKINASFAEMGNEYQRLIRKYEEPVNFAVTSVVDSITDTMAYLRENEEVVDDLVFATGALATVLAGRLVSSLAASAQGYIANVAAKNQAILADAALAKQAKINAIAERERALYENAAAKRQLVSASTAGTRAAAITRLAATNNRAAASEANLAAATNAYTVAATRATIASRGLNVAMGFLGGPVGVIMTAGLALAYFASQSDTSSVAAKKLETNLYDLSTAFDTLANKKATTQLRNNQNEISKYSKNIEDAYSKIADLKAQQDQAPTGRAASAYSRQIRSLESYIDKQTELRAKLMDTATEIANFEKNLSEIKWTTPKSDQPESATELPENIKRLQERLAGEEARLQISYNKQRQMVITARENDVANKAKYDAILKQLDTKYSEDVKALVEKREAEKIRIQNQAEEKRKNDLRRDLDNRIAIIKGFADREQLAAYNNELRVEQARQQARVDAKRRATLGLAANDDSGELQYNADNQIRDLERQTELNAAAGYFSQREADEAAHQERLFQIKNRYAGALQSSIVAFANFEKQTEADKAQAIVGLGAATFKSMAGQSKKAFKAYKAFAIAQAVINTYQSATGAFTSLASIPIVGPVLGGIAAAAAIMQGMQQVRQIKAQQPAGIAHGGLDYVPNESTYVLQRGERVLSPKQNIEISQMARRYNAGTAAANDSVSRGITLSITNQINVQGSANEQNAQLIGQDIAREVVGVVVANIQSNGAIIRSIRGAA